MGRNGDKQLFMFVIKCLSVTKWLWDNLVFLRYGILRSYLRKPKQTDNFCETGRSKQA